MNGRFLGRTFAFLDFMPGDSPLHALANHRLTPLIAVGALAAVIGCGAWLGLPLGLMAAAGLVLTLVIGLMWQSLQHLSGETDLSFEEALSLAAPTVEEEQKRAVLRALKDLEYERSVGKISEEDFVELSERYRAEAKRLILAVDDTLQERRRKAEELLSKRLHASPEGSSVADRKKKKKRRKSAGEEHPLDPAPTRSGAEEPSAAVEPPQDPPVEERAEEKTP